ncbi:hypothetical protein IFM89_016443 [Coptis chinensis]|uniref:Uncharacterized protein n=1 Tax=Coptis chinensis TaxID=261450 RepID=A0A835GXS2_9MAGN|nr:hypothetical protein IFM89_016443 [Coptis chinensis]
MTLVPKFSVFAWEHYSPCIVFLEEDEVRLDEPLKRSIYNKDGLLEKYDDISWPDNVEWIHKLTVDVNQEQKVDINYDLARELVFYTQGLEGTRKAFEKLQKLGLPFLRPSDYYAEMVKTHKK